MIPPDTPWRVFKGPPFNSGVTFYSKISNPVNEGSKLTPQTLLLIGRKSTCQTSRFVKSLSVLIVFSLSLLKIPQKFGIISHFIIRLLLFNQMEDFFVVFSENLNLTFVQVPILM
jgi:hypothetical protein